MPLLTSEDVEIERYFGIFCGYNLNLENGYSFFCNCKINITTRMDSVLVDIKNIDKYNTIANTSYKVTFKDNIYPDTYYKILAFLAFSRMNNHFFTRKLFNVDLL